ncbi:hypothetical protein ACQ86N_00075 [Puia sp. P3]|uniref:hypothetical protein n=1 Tax=Puia sp. P3 TaxID=3423952 RepID=UPI003D67B83F
MVNELVIQCYRGLFLEMFPLSKFQPLVGDRKRVYADLKSIFTRLYPFKKLVDNGAIIKKDKFMPLQTELFNVVTRHFSSGIINRLFPKAERIDLDTPAGRGTFVAQLLGDVLQVLTGKQIQDFEEQYQVLHQLLHCTRTMGLHPDIFKRERNEWLYNVVFEFQHNNKTERDHRSGLREEELCNLVIGMHQDQKPIVFNGRNLVVSKIDRMIITTTPLKEEEIVLYKQKKKIWTDLAFVMQCDNVTNQILHKYESERRQREDKKPQVPREQVPFIGTLISQHPNISRVVLDAYYNMVPQPKSKDEIPENYIGPLHWYNAPFRIRIHEAFPLMPYWELLDYNIQSGYFREKGISDEDIWQIHLKRYSDGFEEGYYSFEEEYLSQKTVLFGAAEDKQRFIYDFVVSPFLGISGFPETHGTDKGLLSGYLEAGKMAGWFYRAWYLIIENSHRFEPMFKPEENHTSEFIPRLAQAIETLQRKSDQHKFIRELKSKVSKDESEFRNFIHNNFDGGEFHFIEAEGAHGLKRTDLRVRDKKGRTYIIEFKGWWNTKDRKWVTSQVADYLTDFESTGYVFMVNDLKKDILSDYKKNVENSENGYIVGSWQVKKVGHSDYEYYVSQHKRGNKIKTIYHFIYRVYP